jgi:hypothetical protein
VATVHPLRSVPLKSGFQGPGDCAEIVVIDVVRSTPIERRAHLLVLII